MHVATADIKAGAVALNRPVFNGPAIKAVEGNRPCRFKYFTPDTP